MICVDSAVLKADAGICGIVAVLADVTTSLLSAVTDNIY